MVMAKEIVGDKVILSLDAETIEQELANLEMLENILVRKLKSEQDRKELRATFECAKTAMQMLWCGMQGEELTQEDIATIKARLEK